MNRWRYKHIEPLKIPIDTKKVYKRENELDWNKNDWDKELVTCSFHLFMPEASLNIQGELWIDL